MTSPTFGISFQVLSNEPRSVIGSDMSVIGIVGTAPTADPTTFPLDTPVLMFSNDSSMLSLLGTSGTLVDGLTGIGNQLGESQSAAKVVVVRVAAGSSVDATITNIVGSQTNKTGIWALPEAATLLGIMPRLICIPGFTSQTKVGLANPVIAAPGSGGANGTFNLAFTGGTGSGAAGTFTVAGGAVTGVTLTSPGVYSVAPTISLAASSGLTGASITTALQTLANPVCAALDPVLERMLAIAFVDGPATNLTDFTNWRNTLASKRLVPLETAAKVGVSATVTPASPYVCGLQVKVDFENIGLPVKVAANREVYGIVAPNRPIPFSLVDGATEGQMILSQQGAIIIRGEAGVETAIATGGFIFVGAYTASNDTDWQFYNVVRMRDYIHLAMLKTLRYYLGQFNLTGHTIQAIYNTMEAFLNGLKSQQAIIGFKLSLPLDLNPATDLRNGKVTLLFQAEEPPPLMQINIQSAKYLAAYDAMISNIQAQLDQTITA